MDKFDEQFTEEKIEELNKKSKVHLTLEETEVAQDAFQFAINSLNDSNMLEKLNLVSTSELEYARNRIKIRIGEMFDNEVETNI